MDKNIFYVCLFLMLPRMKCCTEMFFKTDNDNSIVVGRALEYAMPLNSNIVLEPAGTRKSSFKPVFCMNKNLHWISKYDVICIDGMNQPVCVDGVNSAGLSASSLQFPGFAHYENVTTTDCQNTISNLQIVDYIVGNFHSTKEVRQSMDNHSFPKVFNQLLFGMKLDIHVSIVDSSGDAFVLEYTREGRKLHINDAKVVTGSPSYDFHQMNLKHAYAATWDKNMLRSIPSDCSSTSQFIRAATLLRHFPIPKQSMEEGVNTMFHLLNVLDITKGIHEITTKQNPSFIYTQLAVVKDLKNLIIYVRSYTDLSIRKIELKDIRPNIVVKVPVERKFSTGVTDILHQFYTKKTKN